MQAITPAEPTIPALVPEGLALAGQTANAYARAAVFTDFLERKAARTVRRHRDDLATFAIYLAETGIPNPPDADALQTDPEAWRGITWGLVAGFVRWMLAKGYAVGTVNVKLSTVKTYAKLAHAAGALDNTEAALIANVRGYGHKEAVNLDAKRETTRLGHKKAQPVRITPEVAAILKRAASDTPQAKRDAAMMALLLDHGLRVGELATLKVGDVDLEGWELRFYREKVKKTQTHRLTLDAVAALVAYMAEIDASDPEASLLRASKRGGKLTDRGISTRAITKRVRLLGERFGIQGLSAHDCRHYWATQAARNGTDVLSLKQAGGWASLAMPARYVEESAIANEGVRLP